MNLRKLNFIYDLKYRNTKKIQNKIKYQLFTRLGLYNEFGE